MPRTLHSVIQRWQRDEAALLAAAVSYYIALSLFPVLLILTSGLGAFFKWTHSGNDARAYLLEVIGDQAAPSLATAIEPSLGHIEDYSPLAGPIGMAILLFAALAIFAQFERAFDRVWNVRAVNDGTAMQVLGEATTAVTDTNEVDSKHVAVRRPITAWRMPNVAGRLFDVAFAALLIYVALFLELRHFRSRDVMQPANAETQRVVRFSNDPRLHRVALRIFAPLISTLPGPYAYAHADE